MLVSQPGSAVSVITQVLDSVEDTVDSAVDMVDTAVDLATMANGGGFGGYSYYG